MSLHMYVYFISLFYTKRGRRILRVYICMHICFVYAKRGEKFSEFYACLSSCLCIYVCLSLCTLLNILLFIAMQELRGGFYEAYL